MSFLLDIVVGVIVNIITNILMPIVNGVIGRNVIRQEKIDLSRGAMRDAIAKIFLSIIFLSIIGIPLLFVMPGASLLTWFMVCPIVLLFVYPVIALWLDD